MTVFSSSTALSLCFVTLLAALSARCQAFTPSPLQQQHHHQLQSSTTPNLSKTSLSAGLFGENGIVGNLFGKEQQDNGPKTVVDLAAKDVKIGALRFLLNIYLVGEQNKPAPKSWLTRQGDDGKSLQIYYNDGSGMLQLELQEYAIKAVRYGEKPSLQYVLQESILLHGILDELAGVAFDVEAEQEKRLLYLANEDVIDKARETLPARAAS